MDKKMLIVDDEVGVCDNLKGFFKMRGFAVDVANTGKEALDKVRKDFFPVILTDIRMPEVSGVEVLKEARKLHPESKVIMITGYDEEETKNTCLEAGCHKYLTKPINLAELNGIIDEIFKE